MKIVLTKVLIVALLMSQLVVGIGLRWLPELQAILQNRRSR